MEKLNISKELKERIGFKKIDLVNYLPISRSTLYVYMEYYESDQKDLIPDENIIKLFDYILQPTTTKNDLIKFMLDTFDEKDVTESKQKNFGDKNYGDEESVMLLQKHLKVLRKAAKWDIKKLNDETGISEERLMRIENGEAKITKPEAIALFTSLCRESREKPEDDILPITFAVIFDEHNLTPEEKEVGLHYISAVVGAPNETKKEVYKENLQNFTGDKIKFNDKEKGKGVFIGAAAIASLAVVVGGLLIKFIKK